MADVKYSNSSVASYCQSLKEQRVKRLKNQHVDSVLFTAEQVIKESILLGVKARHTNTNTASRLVKHQELNLYFWGRDIRDIYRLI